MWAVPDPSSVILSHPKSSSNSDMAILTFCGKDTRRGLSLLHRELTEEPEGGRSSPAAQLVLPFETEQTKYTQQPTQFNE